MQLIADLDENLHASVLGLISCSQLKEEQYVRFLLDTCSTITALLDIEVVKLGLVWKNLKKTKCDTATGSTWAFVMPKVKLRLEIFNNGKKKLYPFSLKAVNLLPPDDPTTIFPVQYVFAYSLLGMDILKNFRTWTFEYEDKKLILET